MMSGLAAAGEANTDWTDTNFGTFGLIKDHELVDI